MSWFVSQMHGVPKSWPRLKVIDFGLSALGKPQGPNKGEEWLEGLRGTPHFMAPEVYNGLDGRKHGFPCDLWSVGVMLYYVLTGMHPFSDC